MRRLLKHAIAWPESPLRLLAAWFTACTVFEVLRERYLLSIGLFAVIVIGVFALFTVAQWLAPFPRFSTLMTALCTIAYATVLVGNRINGDRTALYITVLFAVMIVLFPLMHREPHRLLPFTFSKKWCIAAVVTAGALFTLILGAITCLRYATFTSPNYDFGIFCNMFHNMSTTGLPTVSCERAEIISHFAVHISPIYYLILPFYMIFPSPLTLQIAQAVVLASGLVPLYLLARHFKLSYAVTAMLAALYALYPPLSTGCLYDLHENCFLPALLLWLFVCYEKQRFALMCIPAVLILGVKEDAAVYLVFFGLYLLFARRDWKRAVPLIVVAAAYFALAVHLLQNYGQGAMFGRYNNVFEGNPVTGGFFGTLLRDPAYFLTQIANNAVPKNDNTMFLQKMDWLFRMLLPFGLLLWTPRGKYGRLFLLLPLILNLLTRYGYQYDITFQYSFGCIPFLFYLLIQNAADAPPRFRREQLAFGLVAAWLMYLIMVWSPFVHYTRSMREKRETYATMERVLDVVPDDVSVTASTMLLPHLAQRPVIYEDFYHRDANGTIIPDTDYAVLDIRPHFRNQSTPFIETYLSVGYTVIYEEPELIVILRAPKKAP